MKICKYIFNISQFPVLSLGGGGRGRGPENEKPGIQTSTGKNLYKVWATACPGHIKCKGATVCPEVMVKKGGQTLRLKYAGHKRPQHAQGISKHVYRGGGGVVRLQQPVQGQYQASTNFFFQVLPAPGHFLACLRIGTRWPNGWTATSHSPPPPRPPLSNSRKNAPRYQL